MKKMKNPDIQGYKVAPASKSMDWFYLIVPKGANEATNWCWKAKHIGWPEVKPKGQASWPCVISGGNQSLSWTTTHGRNGTSHFHRRCWLFMLRRKGWNSPLPARYYISVRRDRLNRWYVRWLCWWRNRVCQPFKQVSHFLWTASRPFLTQRKGYRLSTNPPYSCTYHFVWPSGEHIQRWPEIYWPTRVADCIPSFSH